MGEDGRYWFEKRPLPVVFAEVGVWGCQTEKSLGSVRIHSQAKVEITSFQVPAQNGSKSGDKSKVQGPASGPGRRKVSLVLSSFIEICFSYFPLAACHPDSRQPHGVFFFFSSTVDAQFVKRGVSIST